MRPTAFSVVVVVVVAAVAVSGCGGGKGGGASGGTTTVGILVPLSGDLAPFGKEWADAAQLAVQDANTAKAAPGGGRFKSVLSDEGSNPATAVPAAKKLISTRNASLLIGPTSDTMPALIPIAKRARVPVIASAAGSVALSRQLGDYAYRTVASDAADGLAVAAFISSKGATRVSIVVDNSQSTISVGATVRQSLSQQGIEAAAPQVVNPGQSSYRAEVSKLLATKPTWVLCACGQQSGTSIIKELAALGYSGERFVSADLTTPGAIKAVGAKTMEGVYGELPATDEQLPAYKALARSYQSRLKRAPGPYAANTYDAMAVGLLAATAAKSTAGEAMNAKLETVANPPGVKVDSIAKGVAALRAGKDIDYQGASGPVDFDKTGSVRTPYQILQARNGKFRQVKFYAADALGGK